MTDRELLQQCHDMLAILLNANVPLMQALKARLAQTQRQPHVHDVKRVTGDW